MEDICVRAKALLDAALTLECDAADEFLEASFCINNPEAAQYLMDKLSVLVFEHIYYDILEWCGCGSPGDAYYEVYKYLKARQLNAIGRIYGIRNLYENQLLLCLAYTLDSVGFTDHGTSIVGAWLTDTGTAVITAIEASKKFEIIK